MKISPLDARLAQQKNIWKVATSLWILGVALGLGFFSFVGWIAAGFIAQSRRVWATVAAWGAATFVLWGVLMGSPANDPQATNPEPWENLTIVIFLVVWLGGIAHGVAMVRPVMKDRLLYKENLAAAISQLESGGRSRTTPLTKPVDVNSAPVDVIATIPDVDPELARAVVQARRVRGGFTNLDELTQSVPLQAHQVAAFRESTTFGPFDSPNWQRGPLDV